jgi:hypothetical protein
MDAAHRPRIVWDLDDTLNELMREWLAWHGRRQPKAAPVRFEELRENPPHRLLGISPAEYLASLDGFRLSAEARAMRPVPEIRVWFEVHGFAFEHHVLTARPVAMAPAAAEWVFAHFGKWIRHFHFVPALRAQDNPPDQGTTKGEVIARFGGADFFVDDSRENLKAAAAAVPTCLLVPRPWNGSKGTLAEVLATLTAAA